MTTIDGISTSFFDYFLSIRAFIDIFLPTTKFCNLNLVKKSVWSKLPSGLFDRSTFSSHVFIQHHPYQEQKS